MKLLKKYRMYQAPRVREASLETEGVFCQSLFRVEVDELDVITSDTIVDDEGSHTVGNYIEF